MPKPKAHRREERRLARDLARRHLAAAFDALIAEGPPRVLPTDEAKACYLTELHRLRWLAIYWDRAGRAPPSGYAAAPKAA